MSISRLLLTGFAAVSLCSAQSIDIRGVVRDSVTGNPLKDVAVRLLIAGLSDTTDAGGNFVLADGATGAGIGSVIASPDRISVASGRNLRIELNDRSKVEIAIYSAQGRLVHSTIRELPAGAYAIAVPVLTSGIHICRARIGSQTFTLRLMNNGVSGRGDAVDDGDLPVRGELTKQASAFAGMVDTIVAVARGYVPQRVLVSGQVISGLEIRCRRPGAATVVDVDGNLYHTVTIGTQTWMVENLRTTRFADGTPIPDVNDNAGWSVLASPGYCWYSNDSTYKNPYGAMYNWYAASSGRLAPTGWRVPTDADWSTLVAYAGGDALAGKKLKEVGTAHWNAHDPYVGTDDFGFDAIAGGYRLPNGEFHNANGTGAWWSSNAIDDTTAWGRAMYYRYDIVNRGSFTKTYGFSVRCIKDTTGATQFLLNCSVNDVAMGSIATNPAGTTFDSNSVVILTATARTGYTFTSWSGDLRGSANPDTLVMTGNMSVSAVFAVQDSTPSAGLQLSALSLSSGTLVPAFSPAVKNYAATVANGISLINVSATAQSAGATIAVNGNPIPSGGTSNAIPLDFGSNTLTATVTSQDGASSNSYVITITRSGPVCSNPATPSGFTATAQSSTSVRLTWVDNASNETAYMVLQSTTEGGPFSSYLEQLVPNTTSCTVWNLTPGQTYYFKLYCVDYGCGSDAVFASVTLPPATTDYTLAATANPPGAGTVSASPSGSTYSGGTVVTLTATPANGYTFAGWSGDLSGTANPATVTVTSNLAVTANFSQAVLQAPVLSGPSSVSADFALTVTYDFGQLTNYMEYYEFEYSAGASIFTALHKSPVPTRSSPYVCQVQWQSQQPSGTYQFRARVYSSAGLSPWSSVLSVAYSRPAATTVTLTPEADNLVVKSSLNSTYENTVYSNFMLEVGNTWGTFYDALSGTMHNTYIFSESAVRFPLPSAMTGKTIMRAELKLFTYSAELDADLDQYQVAAYAGPWSESSLTYNTRPQYYSTLTSTANGPSAATEYTSFDVTSIVQKWTGGASGWPNNGFRIWDGNYALLGSTSNRSAAYHCRESGGTYFKPQLIITYQ